MLQLWVNHLPENLSSLALGLAMAGVLIGLGLWLAGAKISRWLLTLTLVALGAWVGLRLPRWFGWSIDGMGPAVGLSVVLGVSGYILHRLWVGVGLGLVLALWTVWAMWFALDVDQRLSWPAEMPVDATLPMLLGAIWSGVPDTLSRLLPFAAGAALMSGFAMTILYPRVALVLMHSLSGVTLVVMLGLLLIQTGDSSWLQRLPTEVWAQATLLGGMTLLGALVQCRLGVPNEAAAAEGAQDKADEDN